jgi:hypothetical protein
MAGKRAAASHPLNGYGMEAKELSGGDGIHKRFKAHKGVRVTSIDHFKSPSLNWIDIVPTLMLPPGLAEALEIEKNRIFFPLVIALVTGGRS